MNYNSESIKSSPSRLNDWNELISDKIAGKHFLCKYYGHFNQNHSHLNEWNVFYRMHWPITGQDNAMSHDRLTAFEAPKGRSFNSKRCIPTSVQISWNETRKWMISVEHRASSTQWILSFDRFCCYLYGNADVNLSPMTLTVPQRWFQLKWFFEIAQRLDQFKCECSPTQVQGQPYSPSRLRNIKKSTTFKGITLLRTVIKFRWLCEHNIF